jgi:hypothetical protein
MANVFVIDSLLFLETKVSSILRTFEWLLSESASVRFGSI